MADDTLFLACNGHVAAVRTTDGVELWRTELIKVSRGLTAKFATASSPICLLEHEGRIFVGCNGHLFCLDAASGEVLWHNSLQGMGHEDVTLAMAGKAVQIVPRRPSG